MQQQDGDQPGDGQAGHGAGAGQGQGLDPPRLPSRRSNKEPKARTQQQVAQTLLKATASKLTDSKCWKKKLADAAVFLG